MVTWFSWVFPVVVMVTVIPCEGFTTCEKISACSCRSEDGVIDLSPIDGKGTPRFSVVSGFYTYLYNPCTSFTSDLCFNVAIGESDASISYCRDIGQHSTSEFVTDSGGLTIKMQDVFLYVTSFIKLVCDPNQEGDFRLLSSQYPNYNFQLTSKYACPAASGGGGGGGGLSTGSILCLILLVLVCVYLVGGGVYNRMAKQANGADVIPNVTFWKELPSLIKDGAKFAVSGGKHNPGYEGDI